MIGFHFPPSAISSGHLRLLAFAKYLPEFSWRPTILSASECAYEKVSRSSVAAVPKGIHVHRAFALDTRKHLGVHGRYPSILARPDRWISWWPAAVLSGLRLIRRHRIRAIWSTYPIMSAHCVAHTLSHVTGIPWIADFRDPVMTSVTGKNRMTVLSQMRWEQRVVFRAARTVFTTPGAMRACVERYPPKSKGVAVIPNGFDEDDFADLPAGEVPERRDPLHLVHAGVLYPGGRNPTPFFEALASLRSSGILDRGDIRVTLRASGSESLYAGKLEQLGLADIVALEPFLPYTDALEEQAHADGLLLFQGQQFDHQIPAKLYEYIRIGKPIFALVGPEGDTAAVLRDIGNAITTPMDDRRMIMDRLLEFMRGIREGAFVQTPERDVAQYSRRHATGQLAALLNEVSGGAALD